MQRITDDEMYVVTDTAIGHVSEDAVYTPLLDLTAFEFPTEFRSFLEVTPEGVVVQLWDPVYELTLYDVHDDGTVEQLPWSDHTYRVGSVADYELYLHDKVVYAAYRGDASFLPTKLPNIDINRRQNYWPIGSDAVLFPHKDSIETGRELTVRHLIAGDVNLDGFFDSADLIELMARGQYEDGIAGNSHHLTGDFDGDGEFSTSDLITALAEGPYRA
jgi:hypothetical protein